MENRKTYWIAIIVSLITLALYLPALRNDFVLWDDDIVITSNIHLRSFDWAFLKWAFTDVMTAKYWHPVTWVSHALDYAVWGMNPAGHHLTGILLHAVNTFLVILLVTRLLETAHASPYRTPQKDGEGALPLRDEQAILITAGVTGVLFGIHPLHVEPAVWLSERKGLLYALFFLLSVIAYIRHIALQNRAHAGTAAKAFSWSVSYVASLVFFVLALASKPTALTLPLVLLILDWYPFQRAQSLKRVLALIVEKIPFLAVAALVVMITYRVQQSFGFLAPLDMVPVATRMLVMCRALAMYLWNTALPYSLSPLYPYPQSVSAISSEFLGSALLVVGITVASVLTAKKQRLWLSLWGYYVVLLLPVLGLVQIGYQYMADRYVYLPSVGPFLLMGLASAKWWTGEPLPQHQCSRAWRPAAAIALALAVGIVLSVLTVRQIAVWHDTVSLWSSVIEKEPKNAPIAYINRGAAFGELKQPDRALEDFNAAIALDPLTGPYGNRGKVLHNTGLHDRALEDYAKAIKLHPADFAVFNNRGNLFKDMGKLEEALSDYTTAIALKPDYAEAYTNRGIIYGELERYEPALADFTAAIAANPYYADAYTARGLALINAGQAEKALYDLNKAVSLKPTSVEAHLNRGVAYERLDKLQNALEDYNATIELDPSDYLAYNNRGNLYAKMNQVEKAMEDQTKALLLKPDYAKAYFDRGGCYKVFGKMRLAKADYQKACTLGSKAGCAAMRTVSP